MTGSVDDEAVDIVAEVAARIVAGYRWPLLAERERYALRERLANELRPPLAAVLDGIREQARAEAAAAGGGTP